MSEIRLWLDNYGDGWHDLRDSPEDLPGEHQKVSLILAREEKRFVGVDEYYYYGLLHWRDHDHKKILGVVYAWKYMVIEEVPDRFKITSEEINQHKDPMMGQL